MRSIRDTRRILHHRSSCAARAPFVRVDGTAFRAGDAPYAIAGTNMWYAAYLGAGTPDGNRDRLKRELDRLTALGVDNVRILGSAEYSPLKNSVRPTFRDRAAHYNEELLRGLDLALAEMGRRGMKAVIYLTNFWEWSGGMMTYLYWTNGGRYIDMNDPAHPWPEFPDMSSEFYGNAPAVAMYHDYVRAVVDAPQQRHRPALPRRSGDHGVAARQRAPAGGQHSGRAAAHARLPCVDRTRPRG